MAPKRRLGIAALKLDPYPIVIHFYRHADSSLYRSDDGKLAGERWSDVDGRWCWDGDTTTGDLTELPLLAVRAIWRNRGYSTGTLTR